MKRLALVDLYCSETLDHYWHCRTDSTPFATIIRFGSGQSLLLVALEQLVVVGKGSKSMYCSDSLVLRQARSQKSLLEAQPMIVRCHSAGYFERIVMMSTTLAVVDS